MALKPAAFRSLHAPLLGAVEGGGAERAVIVVDAAAGHLHGLPFSRKPFSADHSIERMPKGVVTSSIDLPSSSTRVTAW